MATKRFSKRANFMLAPLDVVMLQELAEDRDTTTSEVIRALIRNAYREAFKGRTPKSKAPTESEIIAKAIQRYFRDASGEHGSTLQPSQVDSEIKGRVVVLANVNGELARYRYEVDSGGRLRFTEEQTKVRGKR
jgi:hypothetical protein